MAKPLKLKKPTAKDVKECYSLAQEAAKNGTAHSRRGRTEEEQQNDFFNGFMGERALALTCGKEAYAACKVQQERRHSAFGDDFLGVDVKTLVPKLSIDEYIDKDYRLSVTQSCLDKDKHTVMYALVASENGNFYLLGWCDRVELLCAPLWFEKRARRISELREPGIFPLLED